MSSVKVVQPGLLTTVQDLGRHGFQRFGVPVAGAFDQFSAQVANWLVGNPAESAVLECTLAGPTLVSEVNLVAAICGGEVAASLDGQPLPMWQSFLWPAGKTLALGNLLTGARAYLAIGGGWQVPLVMGSRSTYLRANLGGHQGRKLQAGDQLPVQAVAGDGLPLWRLPRSFWPSFPNELILRYLPGPQDNHFDPAAHSLLVDASYSISQASDRMGVRLRGTAIIPTKPDIISDAIAYGSIQVPKDGQPIIMGPDRQTTGGYPKIGTVIGPDMSRLAQAKPGDRVKFKQLSIASGQDLARQMDNYYYKIRQIVTQEIIGREFRVKIGKDEFFSFVEAE